MRRHAVPLAIALALAHLAISMLHGAAHQRLAIALTRGENLFVWIVILIAPLLAAALLLVKRRRAGGWLMAISMAGAFLFGVTKHFIAAGADNAFGVPPGSSGTTFMVTAVLLAVTEALACWAGFIAAQKENAPD